MFGITETFGNLKHTLANKHAPLLAYNSHCLAISLPFPSHFFHHCFLTHFNTKITAYLGHPKTLSKRTKDLQLSLRPAALAAAQEVSCVILLLLLFCFVIVSFVLLLGFVGLFFQASRGGATSAHTPKTSTHPLTLSCVLSHTFTNSSLTLTLSLSLTCPPLSLFYNQHKYLYRPQLTMTASSPTLPLSSPHKTSTLTS